MIGKSMSQLSKYYNGKSHRVANPHSEPIAQNSFSNKLPIIDSKLIEQNLGQQKNLNGRKLESSATKKIGQEIDKSSPNTNFNNYPNINHQQHKKFIDSLNDKNMCHFIFQQHLNLKSQSPFAHFDLKQQDNKTEKSKTNISNKSNITEVNPQEDLYYSKTPPHLTQVSNQFKKKSPEIDKFENSISPQTMLKMPPPNHSNLPSLPSPPLSYGTKQLSKLKRFLTTLQQFAVDISPETGDRVRHLVLNLVNSVISIEEFHSKLQEATNFPLRPFVIPFLRANLPLLQFELLHFARLSKMNSSEFLSQNVDSFLFSENMIQNSTSPNQFQTGLITNESQNNKLKRKSPDIETIAPPPNKKTAQNIPMLYISTPNGQVHGHMQSQNQSGPIRLRPSPPQPPINLPPMSIPPPPGVLYPIPMPNANTSKQPYPSPQLLPNHFKNFMNNHAGPSNQSPNSFFPVPNSHFQNRENQFNQILNSSRNSPLNNYSLNVVNNSLNQTSTNSIISNQVRNSPKEDDIEFRETKGKDKNIKTYMRDFEQELVDVLDLESVDKDFKNIDNMLNSIFEMVDRTQKVLDTIQSKAIKLKKQKEIYENELKRNTRNLKLDKNQLNDSKKTSDDQLVIDEQTSSEIQHIKKEDDNESKKKEENSTDKCWNCGRKSFENCPRCLKAKYCSIFCMNKNWETVHYKECCNQNKIIEDKYIDNLNETFGNEESFNDSDKQEIGFSFSKSDEDKANSISDNSFEKSKELEESPSQENKRFDKKLEK